MELKKRSKTRDPTLLVEPVIELAHEAGQRILKIYDTDFDVTHKDDNSPLTKADLASHSTIVAGLNLLTPDIPILSEESADIPFTERSRWVLYWLIDPLDGTREFVKRNGEFTVNIALIHNGCPILGVVHVPVSGVSYYGCGGQGAFKRLPNALAQPIHVRKLTGGTVKVVGSRSHQGDSLNTFLTNLGDYELISMGSALKFCLIAEGRADIYPRLGLTSEWDTAAAQCVVEQAGGHVTATTMQPLRYNTKESLINPHFFVFGDDNRDWCRYMGTRPAS
jgi:3''(2''),5''-bisphosphate nucleotidase, bacterial